MTDASGPEGPFDCSPGGIGLSLEGSGACWFTGEAAGDFTDPTAEQLDGLARERGVAGFRFSRSPQAHGREVRLVRSPEEIREGEERDGQVTTLRDVVCAVRTADCLPVALLSPDAAGVVHAGWRGLAAGVIDSGLQAMRQAGDGAVTAVIGPGARSCCYQAGEEVHEAFAPLGAGARVGDRADLPWIAREQLLRAGAAEVVDCGLCTICAAGWHSYRRDGEDAGRSLALAWRS